VKATGGQGTKVREKRKSGWERKESSGAVIIQTPK
jgi:hypothetical protein